MDALWFGLQDFKSEKGWFNLVLPKAEIKKILLDKEWYEILIPEDRLAFDSFEKLPLWQDIAANLLARYCERFYLYKKDAWEAPHRHYRPLSRDNANFIKSYRIEAEEDARDLVVQLERLAADLAVKKIPPGNQNFEGGAALFFDRHLYLPLLAKTAAGAPFSAVPVPLNAGEADFVGDLQAFYRDNVAYFADKELYLLRNMSRGKGLGFFEANNFYPDFIMWLLAGDKQYISFIDPKGLRNIGCDDAKIEFYQSIKQTQAVLGNKNIILNAFIASATARAEMLWGKGENDKFFAKKHILFQEDEDYIEQIFKTLAAEAAHNT